MPLKNYVVHNDEIYCWNSETEKINKIAIEEVDIENCPPEVLRGLMSILGETAEKK